MGQTFYFDWEIRFMEWMQSFENPFVSALWTGCTMLGETFVMVGVFGIFYWCLNKEVGKKIAVTLFWTLCTATFLKSLILRRRPYMDHESLKCIRPAHSDGDIYSPAVQGFSCPSAHAALSASFYGRLGFLERKLARNALGVGIPLFVCLSRLYLGVHYPTDVMGGAVIGALFVVLLNFTEKKTDKEYVLYGIPAAVFFIPVLVTGEKELCLVYFIMLGAFGGFMFEARFVKFENAGKVSHGIIRFVMGMASALVPGLALRAVLNGLLPGRADILANCAKGLAFGVSIFIATGLTPVLFKKLKI
ncbi:MAG: phosphatase PAP2 family protein [Oscillospiraceae bacterium]|nr:phosphatase PAP2 family protein [Oscillospiraceae bacterium]